MVGEYEIEFNRAGVVGAERANLEQALTSGHVAGRGPWTTRCEEQLSARHGGSPALLTTSCTHALEMCALLLDIGPGDEVVLPSFTFVSTANAFALRGARVVFADVRDDTLNLDERKLPQVITPRTKCAVAVHYAGVGCDMGSIRTTLESAGNIPLVEDNAHGFLGKYRGQPLGTFGALSTLSFHETKNFSCGEGGALVINDHRLLPRAEVLREKGTNRTQFFRGEVDKYTWVDLGSSYVISDVLAALLAAQLSEMERVQARRLRIWNRYAAELASWARTNGVSLPVVPEGCEHPGHLFYLLLPTPLLQAAFIQTLRDQKIRSVFHYQPLHLSTMGRLHGGQEGDCPVTEDLAGRLVRLPLFFDLDEAQQDRVIRTVLGFEC